MGSSGPPGGVLADRFDRRILRAWSAGIGLALSLWLAGLAARVGTYVRSVTHNRFGAVAVNSRFSRSGWREATGSRRVVVTRFERRAPSIPAARISRAV